MDRSEPDLLEEVEGFNDHGKVVAGVHENFLGVRFNDPTLSKVLRAIDPRLILGYMSCLSCLLDYNDLIALASSPPRASILWLPVCSFMRGRYDAWSGGTNALSRRMRGWTEKYGRRLRPYRLQTLERNQLP